MRLATNEKSWFLYLLECADTSIYTGIARDVTARFAEHLAGKGARYTRSHRPVRILGFREFADHSSALKAEHQVKKLKPAAKRHLAEVLQHEAQIALKNT